MITEEKFYEKASKFALLKNTDDKYFTLRNMKSLSRKIRQIKINHLFISIQQTKLISLPISKKQRTKDMMFLLLDGQLDVHLINHLETKFKDSRFVRVDSDVIDKLIQKEESRESKLIR